MTYTCAECGDSYAEPISMLEHQWSDWVDAGDGTHARSCAVGGETEAETHDYQNGSCICGAAANDPQTISLGEFTVMPQDDGGYTAAGSWLLDWSQTPGDDREIQFGCAYRCVLTSDGDPDDPAKKPALSLSAPELSDSITYTLTITGMAFVKPDSTFEIIIKIFYMDGETEVVLEEKNYSFTYTAGVSLEPIPSPEGP